MAGHRFGKEAARIMDDPEKPRSDVGIYRLTKNALFAVWWTVVGGDSVYCKQAYMRTCARTLSPRSMKPTPSPLCDLARWPLLGVLLYVFGE